MSCTGSYESTLVKMPHCWKSHAAAQLNLLAGICPSVPRYTHWHVFCENTVPFAHGIGVHFLPTICSYHVEPRPDALNVHSENNGNKKD